MLVASDPSGFGRRWRATFSRRRSSLLAGGPVVPAPFALRLGQRVLRTGNLSACSWPLLDAPLAVSPALVACRAIAPRVAIPVGPRPGVRSRQAWLGWMERFALQQSPAPSPPPGGSAIAFPALRRRPCRSPGASSSDPEFLRRLAAKTVKQQRATHKHLRFAKLVPKAARGVFSDTAAGIAAVSILPIFIVISGYYPSTAVPTVTLDDLKLRSPSESFKQGKPKLSTDRDRGSG